MPTKPPPIDLPTQTFPNASAFATYLDAHHLTAPGIYVKLAKKASQIPSITAVEAVETALCYGWIDGRANSIDSTYWTVRYTPRRAKSIWSQKNVGTIARLIEEGKMKPAGMAQVQAAKSDGRWEKAYAGPKDMVVPEDLERKLNEEGREEVRVYWEGLKKGERYHYLHQLAIGSVKGREKKIESVIGELTRAAEEAMGEGREGVKSLGKTKKRKAAASVEEVETKAAKPKPAKARPVKGSSEGNDKPRRTGLRSRS